jgi:hypothetical protein
MRNRGFTRLLVRGRDRVQAIALWFVMAHNFMQMRFLKKRRQDQPVAA